MELFICKYFLSIKLINAFFGMKSNMNGDNVQIKMDIGEIKINFSFKKTLNNDIGL